MSHRKVSARIVAITAGCATLLGAAGVATAAGALPGAASPTATVHADKAGVSVKGPNAHSAGHADTRGRTATTADEPGTTSKGHGPAVSELARTTTAVGADKGAEISTFASGGKSKAGKQAAGKPEKAGTPDAHAGGHTAKGKPASPGKSGDHRP